MARAQTPPLLPPFRRTIRALGEVILPAPDPLDADGWSKAEAIMEEALASRPPAMRAQLRLFLRVLNLLPLLSTGRTLHRLPLAQRAVFLSNLQRSRLAPFRRGLWGIRTLLFMGYYNQDAVRREIGYGAHPEGWDVGYGKGDS